jgi:hypothetical protein
MVLSFDQQFLNMSAQVFAVKRIYSVCSSGATIGRTGFCLHPAATAKPPVFPTLQPLFQPGTVIFIQ